MGVFLPQEGYELLKFGHLIFFKFASATLQIHLNFIFQGVYHGIDNFLKSGVF
jgi:hypothetical protein